MLLDIVYEFYVKYIFGGTLVKFVDGATTYDYCVTFLFPKGINGWDWIGNINAITFQHLDGTTISLSLGNYLSFIATLISMVVIVIICCLLIKKIYNMCAHIIG